MSEGAVYEGIHTSAMYTVVSSRQVAGTTAYELLALDGPHAGTTIWELENRLNNVEHWREVSA